MSQWQEYDFEGKLIEILHAEEFTTRSPHHFGQPFVTAYQLAAAFEEKYPDLCRELNKVVDGAGPNNPDKDSLARYLAHQLTAKIKAAENRNEPYPVEAAWLSSNGLGRLHFIHNRVEKTGGPNAEFGGYSLFRLKPD
jgi:hypothetical protein